jgi:hypothetical protein
MFDPNLPAYRSRIVSAELRGQFNELKALIDAVTDALLPIGSVVGWCRDLAGALTLPGKWVECNGQLLNDGESPLNLLNIPNLNGEQRFLRGASASGGTGGADTWNLAGEVAVDNNLDASTTTVASAPQPDLPLLPSYYEVVWVMRVK